jgi:hypothetical protein
LRQARLKLAALTEAIKSPSASVVALVVECGIASWLTGTAAYRCGRRACDAGPRGLSTSGVIRRRRTLDGCATTTASACELPKKRLRHYDAKQ